METPCWARHFPFRDVFDRGVDKGVIRESFQTNHPDVHQRETSFPIGSGALVTALLQSSSAVSLMVLAFVGAGVMNLQNAIGVIMGSNIGTTLTAWIIATIGVKIKIESLALPFI